MQSDRFSIGLRVVLAVLTLAWLGTNNLANGQESVLHSFQPNGMDGAFPSAGLVADSAGNLYGSSFAGGTYNLGAVFELIPQQGGGWTEKLLHSFGQGDDGANPAGALIFDANGNLYGTTSEGGGHAAGMVFELTPQSGGMWTETSVHHFRNGDDGAFPRAGLIFDTAGNLYGTTYAGGGHGAGTVFEITPNQGGGWTESVIHNFGSGTDGAYPLSNLIFDGMGNLYGTTQEGGVHNFGTVFEVKPKQGGGWTETVLHPFNNNGVDGIFPEAGLIFDSRGNLFGTTFTGGTRGKGTFYELLPQSGGGWMEIVQHSFSNNGLDGISPSSSLMLDSAGNVYGTTAGGGTNGFGTVFQFVQGTINAWTEYVLHSFNFNGSDGVFPEATLIRNVDGNFYGTTSDGGAKSVGTVFELAPQQDGGWQESVAYSFAFKGTDGAVASTGLISDGAGNFYGTTSEGGGYDSGAAFKLAPANGGHWTESLVHNFGSGLDGATPAGGLILDNSGNFYGTTTAGGVHDVGTVFEISPKQGGGWTEQALHFFNLNGTDGGYPYSGVVFDASGNLYGTTQAGGTTGNGTVFRLSPRQGGGWTEHVLYSFIANGQDGISPYGGLTVDAHGNLYGTTKLGGSLGEGTVFELSPGSGGSWIETVLYSLGGTAGAFPVAGLIFDMSGNLYGTTTSGGSSGVGTVFELSPQSNGSWTETVLYSFDAIHGSAPNGSLTFFGSPAALYGTTSSGGANNAGTVFELTPMQGGTWSETDLHDFNPSSGDGNAAQAGVIFDANGNLYGTTANGGSEGDGVVFEITP